MQNKAGTLQQLDKWMKWDEGKKSGINRIKFVRTGSMFTLGSSKILKD
jgi:hypothetical protein